jgi:hypothetical protein
MISDMALKKYIHIWHKNQTPEIGNSPHLPPEAIYRMAASRGMETANPQHIAHLSICPACLREWVFWSRVRADDSPETDASDGETDRERPSTFSGGMLRAAASPGETEALRIASACGRFFLGVLPQTGAPEKGLITIETLETLAERFEGQTATVRDAAGQTILEGRFQGGRAAGRVDHIKGINLSTWSLVVQ